MTDKQSEALRRADMLENWNYKRHSDLLKAAAELRRLDAEVQQWQEKCQAYIDVHDAVVKDSDRLYALNAELVEAVKAALSDDQPYIERCKAALVKATGENNG